MEIQNAVATKQKAHSDLCNRQEQLQQQKGQTEQELERKEKKQKESEEKLMLFQKKLTVVESVLLSGNVINRTI